MKHGMYAAPAGTKDDDLEHQRERGDFIEEEEEGEEGGEGGEGGDGSDGGKGEKKPGATDGNDDDGGAGGDGGEGEGDDKNKTVPYGRFRTVHERAAALEEENRQLKAAQGGKPAAGAEDTREDWEKETNPKTLRKMAREALLEGDTEKATKLDNRADDLLVDAAADRVEQRTAQRDIETAAATAIEKYPWLDHNPKNPERDPEAIAEVVALRDTYIGRGMKPGEALTKAADKIAKLRDDDAGGGDGKKGKDGGKDGDDKDPKAERSQAAIARNAKAAIAQPPPVGGKGNRTTDADGGPDVAKMSDKQFKDMPEEERARARGDFVE